jgi:chromosome segregation ATPase
MNELARIYRDTKGKLGQFLDFYNELHLYNIDLDNIQEVSALANQIPQIKDEYRRVSTLPGITKKETQDQQQILSNIGNSISTANGQLSDLQVKIQNATMDINRKNDEILNFEQIQKSMKNSESYKDLAQLALKNVQKYMDQRRNFLLAALTITRNTMVKNPEFQNLLNPAADPYDLPLNNLYIHAAEAEFQELLMDIHIKEIMEVGYMMRGEKNFP